MKKYRDTERDIIISEEKLKTEYGLNADDIFESSGAKTFHEWIKNCTGENGFLEEITEF